MTGALRGGRHPTAAGGITTPMAVLDGKNYRLFKCEPCAHLSWSEEQYGRLSWRPLSLPRQFDQRFPRTAIVSGRHFAHGCCRECVPWRCLPDDHRKKAAEIVSGLSGKNTCLNEIVVPAPDAVSSIAVG